MQGLRPDAQMYNQQTAKRIRLSIIKVLVLLILTLLVLIASLCLGRLSIASSKAVGIVAASLFPAHPVFAYLS